MGTRRPLVVQMVNDPGHTEPRCSFRDENSSAYSDPVPADKVFTWLESGFAQG